MARMKYTEDAPVGQHIYDLYSQRLQFESHSGSFAEYHETNMGVGTILIEGSNLSYSRVRLEGGRISSMTFGYEDGTTFATITGIKIGANSVSVYDNPFAGEFIRAALRHDDRIIGSRNPDVLRAENGNDRVFGRGGDDQFIVEFGNDVMTGGAGSDQFLIRGYGGRSTITDFDPSGGGTDQDYLGLPNLDVTVRRLNRHDTMIEIPTGDRIVLRDVRPAEIDPGDYFFA